MMALEQQLAALEERYSAADGLLRETLHGPGYHTTIPNGTVVRSTLGNLNYALLLLAAGGAAHAQRAEAIIRKLLAVQDTDPDSATYGVWPWFFDEPLSSMAPPDRNWADFIGAGLAEGLVLHAGRLAPELAAAMREALGYAAWAILRRDVQPGYTNIAILGGAVTAVAGEVLQEPRLLAYGRRRLARVVEHTRHHGSFNEYNSPAYTMVILGACERVLALCRDQAAREHAMALLRVAWEIVADHYHPGTGEWAGPHSRAYSDRLEPYIAGRIARRTGVSIPAAADPAIGGRSSRPRFDTLPCVPCPDELRQRFRALPAPELQVRRQFMRDDADPSGGAYATTWFVPDACLGSFSRSSFWTQTRGVLAYWKLATRPPAVLRLHFLHDGRDFASAALRTTQDHHRLLAIFGLVANQGDHHLTLDRPPQPVFRASDFRIRFALTAAEGAAGGSGVGQEHAPALQLSAGDWQALIYTQQGSFDGTPIRWVHHRAEGQAFVDGICYEGPEREFDLRAIAIQAAAALEIVPREAAPSMEPVRLLDRGATADASWAGLTVSGPTGAVVF